MSCFRVGLYCYVVIIGIVVIVFIYWFFWFEVLPIRQITSKDNYCVLFLWTKGLVNMVNLSGYYEAFFNHFDSHSMQTASI